MKKFLFILFSLVVVSEVAAQNSDSTDLSAWLENKIWKVQLPKGKPYAMEMEFRDAGWKKTFLYDEKKKDNSVEGQRKNEERLDSIWRKEDSWNKGVAKITGEPITELSTIEPPRWAGWNEDLTKYYISQMKYPEALLKKNIAGYSVVMFSIDTLGLPRSIHILTTKHKEFDKEVIRLTKALPHCLPCLDKNGKRMECLYTVYVPFLPQHYRDRVRKDSIWAEEQKHCFVEWESPSRFRDGNQATIQA